MKKDSVKIQARFDRLLNAALNMAKGNNSLLNRLENVRLYYGYSEPRYESDALATLGNWNDVSVYNPITSKREIVSTLMSRLAKAFEKIGVECEWDDEWTSCYDCGRLVRTSPDTMWWEPSFVLDDNGAHCKDCASEDEDCEDEDEDCDDEGENELVSMISVCTIWMLVYICLATMSNIPTFI